MKALRNMTGIFALIVAAALTFNFFGCNGDSPVTPEVETISKQKGMHFIKLGDALTSLNKGFLTVSAWVTEKDGGKLEILHGTAFAEGQADTTIEGDYTKVGYGTVSNIKVELDVMPCCIKEDVELSMTLDDQCVDMEFGPHGTTFLMPVLLNITAVGLDLSEANEETLDLYYDNPDTGQWEKVERENVIVTKSTGTLQIVNARIPHFSRYAVAWSN